LFVEGKVAALLQSTGVIERSLGARHAAALVQSQQPIVVLFMVRVRGVEIVSRNLPVVPKYVAGRSVHAVGALERHGGVVRVNLPFFLAHLGLPVLHRTHCFLDCLNILIINL